MTDDEIAERIAKYMRADLGRGFLLDRDVLSCLDGAEVYRLAFVEGVRERAKARRQAKRVRAKVLAALGMPDWGKAGK